MWVRKQDKPLLVKCDYFVVEKSYDDEDYCIKGYQLEYQFILGRYSTLEKAMKVFDELQKDAFRMPKDDEVLSRTFKIVDQYGIAIVCCDTMDLICTEEKEYIVRLGDSTTGETVQGFYSTEAKAKKIMSSIREFIIKSSYEKTFQLPKDEEVEVSDNEKL